MIDGVKRFNSGMHRASHDLIFARTSGASGEALGITAFIVPRDAPGLNVEFYWWTFNMPTDHAEVSLRGVRVGDDAILGELDRGLELAQHFVHENRIRQAASSLGAAAFCIDEAVKWARDRTAWGKPLWRNQGIQFPLAELWTDCELVRGTRAANRRRARPPAPHGGHPPRRDGQLPREPACLRGRRPGHADLRRDGLHAAHALRAHLPPSPPLPNHGGSEEVQLRKVGYELFAGSVSATR